MDDEVTPDTWDTLCSFQATVTCWRSATTGTRMFTLYFPNLHPASGPSLNRLATHLTANAAAMGQQGGRPPREEPPPAPRRGLLPPPHSPPGTPVPAPPKPRRKK